MHYAEIKTCDIANGPGIRVTLAARCSEKAGLCGPIPRAWL